MRAQELPAYLRMLQGAAARAAADAAGAMASKFEDRMVNVTLRETVHAPGQFWKAVAGRPPAYASGALADSIYSTPGVGYVHASALVGATARYAALQEWGGSTRPNNHVYMKWTNSGGTWRKKIVTIPEHPYFRTTRDRMITDGSLSRAAMDAFQARISPYYRA